MLTPENKTRTFGLILLTILFLATSIYFTLCTSPAKNPPTTPASHPATTPTSQPLAEDPTTSAPAYSVADLSFENFQHLYALAPNELLKHIPTPPEPDLRHDLFFQYSHFDNANRAGFDMLYWQNNDVVGMGGLTETKTFTLRRLATQIFRAQDSALEGDLLDTPLSGDFSIRVDKPITPQDYAPALQQILATDFHLSADIQFLNVPRPVLILAGHFHYTPSPDLPPPMLPPEEESLPCFNIYTTPDDPDVTLDTTAICGGGAKTLAATIAWYTHKQVLIEADGIPEKFAMHETRAYSNQLRQFTPAQLAAILTHLTDQTALTITPETRTVPRIAINKKTSTTHPSLF